MTRQASHGWPQPPRLAQHAQHAAPLRPPRERARRVLRLLMAAGVGAAGLCLVVGAVALVASAAGPTGTTTVTSASHQSSAGAPAPHSEMVTHGAGASPGRMRTILSTAGRGNQTTRQFIIGGNGTWLLEWSYHSCNSFDGKGGFTVSEDDAGTVSGPSLSESGTAGQGSTRTYQDAGSHHLVIASGCAWKITVAGQQ